MNELAHFCFVSFCGSRWLSHKFEFFFPQNSSQFSCSLRNKNPADFGLFFLNDTTFFFCCSNHYADNFW
ncbi:hypothetical protein DERF_009603 [Dermatophagoides farinae]|uniref:Uncharacterized protein n=1 Tax=Dermatophagoides farinae TaxID=6954 RepID=A0A922L1P3_DERFA|nr:hypothetical protein DERF_009603 [Dermatophagoides farinae]